MEHKENNDGNMKIGKGQRLVRLPCVGLECDAEWMRSLQVYQMSPNAVLGIFVSVKVEGNIEHERVNLEFDSSKMG